ncbi:MAG TPA: hypothetical protein VIK86_06110 [Candidatus Paceibacterota bacterium]
MKIFLSYLFIILSFFVVIPVYAETTTNSGFIPGQIWYSKASLVEGDTVNIHTAVWNGEKESFSFKVEFYDKNVILGSREVIVNSLELNDVYVPWKITSGDHVISAKIVSSQVSISGKKENVLIDRNITLDDRQFISVVVKNYLGEPISQSDALKNQIEKTSTEINNILPEKVSTSVSDSFSTIDNLRDKTFTQIDVAKKETQKELNAMNSEVKKSPSSSNNKSNIEDAIKKPITYVKLFLLSLLSFVFGYKIVFYGLVLLILFFILRLIYRKIRNR